MRHSALALLAAAYLALPSRPARAIPNCPPGYAVKPPPRDPNGRAKPGGTCVPIDTPTPPPVPPLLSPLDDAGLAVAPPAPADAAPVAPGVRPRVPDEPLPPPPRPDPPPPADDRAAKKDGCSGCAAGGSPGAGLLWALLLAAIPRRGSGAGRLRRRG